MIRRLWKLARVAILLIVVLGLVLTIFAWVQGRRTPAGRPDYVALGSSFAAGAGLGKREPGSPILCGRSLNGYPQQLARLRGLRIVDMSCGGAVTRHLLRGGQFFQGPQIRVITADTKLVTITSGGNDIVYVGDLLMLAARNGGGATGWFARHFWKGPHTPEQRDYGQMQNGLTETIRAVRQRAPKAVIVLATYPTVLPLSGTCPRLNLQPAEADLMRQTADRLASISRAVAAREGALLVDMHVLGAAHNACSVEPWTNGWNDVAGTAFHPTLAGAKATAEAISKALDAAVAPATSHHSDS